ncbi:LacI family DNA-binding transcriptional regulator [Naasia sp. SYSU D00948]|uniref:LacI family DNA-binding transcriptional regulator n=1 Tax=Naasia sp. SYSU D00948 TaxID=2817379 RepID=UPI001B30ED1B|nr:LacI family DNA-binding transcriptional regulator [Naasia sp. SYSU D00948]
MRAPRARAGGARGAGDGEGTSPASGERVTLSDVAAEAGVSLATISKVLNGRPDVAPETRARIEQLVERHGYLRRGAGPRRSTLLEVVFHALESAWALEIVRGAESAARERGLSLVLTESGSRHSPDSGWIDGVLKRRPAGVVLVFSDLDPVHGARLRSSGIPFAIIDPAGDPSPDVPSVGSTNWSGGLAATRHLIDLGHRRIAAITGPEDMMCSRARLDGYRTAMLAAGLTIDEDHVEFGDFQVDGGRAAALRMLASENPPTAIFAGSDLQALGVFEAARLLGLTVPGDVSVVGYDDLPLAEWTSPRLTTIRQPLRDMAETAVRLVLEPRQEGPPARLDLATHLVVRDSTATPRRSRVP